MISRHIWEKRNVTYNPEAIRSTYDEIAEREDRFEKGFSLRNDIPREFIKKHLKAGDVVLDAGGGSGINAIMMAQLCRKVTLLDISPRMLELAAINVQNAGLSERIDLVEGDITNLEQFGDAEFSFVICLGGSLSYVLEKAPRAIQELVRVAKKQSILIVGCDSKYGFVKWMLSDHSECQQDLESRLDMAIEVYEASEYEPGEGARAHLYTVAELTGLLEEAGCEILEVASTPTLMDSWDQSTYPKGRRDELRALELKVCTIPELLGMGHHLFCVARKA
jgi:ubiquinone/menaquinone biosynthesis C-methylase UbiE